MALRSNMRATAQRSFFCTALLALMPRHSCASGRGGHTFEILADMLSIDQQDIESKR
jgi:hypothetical protein